MFRREATDARVIFTSLGARQSGDPNNNRNSLTSLNEVTQMAEWEEIGENWFEIGGNEWMEV